MRADRFDDLTRRLAGAAQAPGTRRALLQAVGLGGAAVSLGPARSLMGPVARSSGAATLARAQAEPSGAVADQAFELDYDLDRIFQFVRDEVAYDPYAGILRGAKGTLWGLAGNAADQAVLLSELLAASLVETRFVVGVLSPEPASVMLATGELTADTVRSRATQLLTPRLDPDVEQPALTPEQEAFVAGFPEFADQAMEIMDRHAADGIAMVSDALAGAGVALPPAAVAAPEAEVDQHIWVQYASGADWIDLDPSMPGAEPGDVFAADPVPLDALPEDLLHRVSFRLIAEQVSGDDVERTELLTFEAPSHELLGVPISLIHPQPESMARIGVSIGGAIQGFRNFVPSLLVGEETVFGTPVTFGSGGGVIDALGGVGADGETLAEWIEVAVTTPAGTRTAVRTVFDRVDPEARAADAIDPSAVPPIALVDAGDPESSFLPLAGLWSFGVVGGLVPEGQATRSVPDDLIVDDLLPALHAYHYAREVQALRLPALEGVRLFHDAPNVTAFRLQPTEVETDAESAAVGLDLLHRGVAVAPGGGGGAHPLVVAGAMAHAVEQTMFEIGGLEPMNLPVTAPIGVLSVFAEARAQGIGVVVLQPGDAGAEPPEMAGAARRLVEEALAAGQIVIVPERPVELGGRERIGWWLVDPATGATFDQMDDGGGSTMTDYALALVKIARCIVAFAGLGAGLGAVARMSALIVTGGDSGDAARTSTGGALGGGAAAVLGYGCVG